MDTNLIFKEMAQYRAIIAQAQKELDKLEAETKEYMTTHSLTELLGDEHKATYKEVVSNRFDSKAFKADHADMYELYKKPSTSMRFNFT